MITVIHGGQTGVDRGAHHGAIEAGLEVGGYMPHDSRDELGLIPVEVAAFLWPWERPGLYARTLANIARAHALLCIVPNANAPYATPGTRITLLEARMRKPDKLRVLVVDPGHPRARVADWLAERIRHHGGAEFRLMVAGPRASRWSSGEVEAAAFVRACILALQR